MSAFYYQFWLFLKIRLQYRLDYTLSFLSVGLGVSINYFLWGQSLVTGHNIGTYTSSQFFSYLMVASFTNMVRANWTTLSQFSREIRSGTVSRHLIKPISLFDTFNAYWLADKSPLMITGALALVFSQLFSISWLPFTFTNCLFYVPALFLAMWLSTEFYFMITISSFWIEDNAGLALAFNIFAWTLIGSSFPLTLITPLIYKAISFTPFPFMAFHPTQILIGQYNLNETVHHLAQGFLWALVLMILRKLMWYKAQQRLQTIGG